jgi:superfamily II DNA or RNA helicase
MPLCHKYLTSHGYVLDKSILGKDKELSIKKELTVKPKIDKSFMKDQNDDVDSYSLFTESKQFLYVPRYYGVKNFGAPDKTKWNSNKSNIKFKGELREYQNSIIESCLKSLKEDGGGVISLYCGAGKTTLALYLACVLKVKTLVVVHKTFLQNQWYDRIKQFTNAKIGSIRQNKVDVENKDIVIGMLQSISMRDYDSKIFEGYSLVIFDECHHTGSRVYSKALQKTGAKYTIGLSATPTRSDGTTKVINWFLGDIIYKLERKGDKNVAVKSFLYETNNKLFVEKKRWFQGKNNPDTVRMRTNLCKITERNNFTVNIIDSLRKKYERKILVIAERRDHLKDLKQELDVLIDIEVKKGDLEPGEVKTGFYMGKMKAYELEESSQADIIFGTFAMAKEGLDIDKLNTLVLASPTKDIVQAIGRIMRKPIKEGDIVPLIVDLIDNFSTFPNWAKQRTDYYKKNKYTISNYMSLDKECISIKDYLINKGIINKKTKNVDIEKEYICYKYGQTHYDFLQEMKELQDSSDEEVEAEATKKDDSNEYNYDPNLDVIFDVTLDNL